MVDIFGDIHQPAVKVRRHIHGLIEASGSTCSISAAGRAGGPGQGADGTRGSDPANQAVRVIRHIQRASGTDRYPDRIIELSRCAGAIEAAETGHFAREGGYGAGGGDLADHVVVGIGHI